MKKLRLLLVAVFMLCLTLTACQSKDSLDGYWVVSEMEALGQKVEVDKVYPDGKVGFLSFEADSKFVAYFVQGAAVVKGKWEKTEKGVKLTAENATGSEEGYEITKDGDKLVLDIQGIAKYIYTKSSEKPKDYDEVVK